MIFLKKFYGDGLLIIKIISTKFNEKFYLFSTWNKPYLTKLTQKYNKEEPKVYCSHIYIQIEGGNQNENDWRFAYLTWKISILSLGYYICMEEMKEMALKYINKIKYDWIAIGTNYIYHKVFQDIKIV